MCSACPARFKLFWNSSSISYAIYVATFTLAYRDDHHKKLAIPNFINKPVARTSKFDFVAVGMTKQFRSRNTGRLETLGELFLQLLANDMIKFAPFLQRAIEKGDLIAHPG